MAFISTRAEAGDDPLPGRPTPTTLNDWALGGVIGKLAGNYWSVPVTRPAGAPGSDALKHFGAAMASFGSIALFHLVGITPEAHRLTDVGGERLAVTRRIARADVEALQRAYATTDEVDVVVFSARRSRSSTRCVASPSCAKGAASCGRFSP